MFFSLCSSCHRQSVSQSVMTGELLYSYTARPAPLAEFGAEFLFAKNPPKKFSCCVSVFVLHDNHKFSFA